MSADDSLHPVSPPDDDDENFRSTMQELPGETTAPSTDSALFRDVTDEIDLDGESAAMQAGAVESGLGKLELKRSGSPNPPEASNGSSFLDSGDKTPPLIGTPSESGTSERNFMDDDAELFPKMLASAGGGSELFGNDDVMQSKGDAETVNGVYHENVSPAGSAFPISDATPAPTITPLEEPTRESSPPLIQPHIQPHIISPGSGAFGGGGGKLPSVAPRTSKLNSSKDHEEDGSDSQTHKIEVTISDSEKRGEGLSSYVAYKVLTKASNVPGFQKSEYSVWRRFSDFLGLYEKLATKHLHNGRIVPPAPDKSVVGMARTKMTNDASEDENAQDFIIRRQNALERFLQRVGQHPVLLQDPDYREFLTMESDLPKASHTAALSGQSVMRLIGRIGDTVNKITFKMDESDQWFEEKLHEIETYDEQFRKLHASVEQLVHFRKELASSSDVYCKSMYLLASCEENTALSRAFSQLAETEEKVGMVNAEQADKDFFIMAELLKDYIGLIGTVKAVFHERVKSWQNWQSAQATLAKKREAKTKFELAGKTDKLPAAKKECEVWENNVQECQDHFENISKMIRKEIKRFDSQRVKEFKATIVTYLESLALTQQQVIKYWESFLPEAKAVNV